METEVHLWSLHGGLILASSRRLRIGMNWISKTAKLFNYNFINYTTPIQLIRQISTKNTLFYLKHLFNSIFINFAKKGMYVF